MLQATNAPRTQRPFGPRRAKASTIAAARPKRTAVSQPAASLATRGGQRLVTYLRLAEVKPPSRLPLGPR